MITEHIDAAVEQLRQSVEAIDAQILMRFTELEGLVGRKSAALGALVLLGADTVTPSKASVESDRPVEPDQNAAAVADDRETSEVQHPHGTTAAAAPSVEEPAAIPPPPSAPRRPADHAGVARVAREAAAAGKPMGRAVAEHFGITPAAATKRIEAAREAGHAIPRRGEKPAAAPSSATPEPVAEVKPLRSPKSPSKMALVCDECEAEFAADRAADLNRHCLQKHGRRPTPAERTPVVASGSGAA